MRVQLGLLAAALALASALASLALLAVVRPASALATSGHCSRAAADRAILAGHFEAKPGEAHPAAQVLCGAFLGPGVEAMVASVGIPSCGRTGDWLVWRYGGSGWLKAFESFGGADLAAVGRDIREAQNVLRPGDAHCFPTGGTRSRVWHWNGSRFSSGGWQYSKPQPKPKPKPARLRYVAFSSPSHNLTCEMEDDSRVSPHVRCQSEQRPQAVTLNASGGLTTCRGQNCLGNLGETPVRLLAYDSELTVGRFHCQSEPTGVLCVVRASGRGFLIDRDGVMPVGH